MYISATLRDQIEGSIQQSGQTLAAFGRKAFETYLSQLKEEETTRQLTKTCKMYRGKNEQVYREWAPIDQDIWPT